MENRERLGSRLGFIMLSCRLYDRVRQCMEIPVDVRTKRRRQLYAALYHLPAGAGTACKVMELSVGRAAQTSPLYMYGKAVR